MFKKERVNKQSEQTKASKEGGQGGGEEGGGIISESL